MKKWGLILSFMLLLFTIPAMAQNHLTFTWTLSSDDTILGSGGGYHLYGSKTTGTYSGSALGSVMPGVNTITISKPGLDKWYFVVTAFSAGGTDSGYSNEVNTTIKPAAPTLNTVQQVAKAIKKVVSEFASIFKCNKSNGGSIKGLKVIES
jgi:hypothetical protein